MMPTHPDQPARELVNATFSVGAYWAGEARFGRVPGIIKSRVGLATGDRIGPVEAVQVQFDPKIISYYALLRWFWDTIKPLRPPENPRFRPAIFVHDDVQMKAAQRTLEEMEFKFKIDLSLLVQTLASFVPAPAADQKYYLQNNPKVLALVEPLFPDRESMIHSTTAVRINSLLGGFATIDELEPLWEERIGILGEPDDLADVLALLTADFGNKSTNG